MGKLAFTWIFPKKDSMRLETHPQLGPPRSQESPLHAGRRLGGHGGSVSTYAWSSSRNCPSGWPKLVEATSVKTRAGRKSLQEAKANPWICICLGRPWNKALTLDIFFQWLCYWCLLRSDHFWNLKDLFPNRRNFSHPPKICVFSWIEFSINKRPSATFKITLIQSFNKKRLRHLIVLA